MMESSSNNNGIKNNVRAEKVKVATFNHRINKWLDQGSFILEGKFSEIYTPTLILAGQNDKILPSAKEAERLKAFQDNQNKKKVKRLEKVVDFVDKKNDKDDEDDSTLFTPSKEKEYNFTGCKDWAQHLASVFGTQCVRFNGKTITVKLAKKHNFTKHHILAFITSYTRINKANSKQKAFRDC
jgi:hypothetical protein